MCYVCVYVIYVYVMVPLFCNNNLMCSPSTIYDLDGWLKSQVIDYSWTGSGGRLGLSFAEAGTGLLHVSSTKATPLITSLLTSPFCRQESVKHFLQAY